MYTRIHIALTLIILSIPVLSFLLFNGIEACISCALGWLLLGIAFIDARNFIIPDELSLPAIPAGLIAAYFTTDNIEPHLVVLEHVMAALAWGAAFYLVRIIYRQLRERDGLGLGDVKLIIAAGAWTGFIGVSYVTLLACIVAISFIISAQIIGGRKLSANTPIPFGAFLAPSIWMVWVFSQLSENIIIGL